MLKKPLPFPSHSLEWPLRSGPSGLPGRAGGGRPSASGRASGVATWGAGRGAGPRLRASMETARRRSSRAAARAPALGFSGAVSRGAAARCGDPRPPPGGKALGFWPRIFCWGRTGAARGSAWLPEAPPRLGLDNRSKSVVTRKAEVAVGRNTTTPCVGSAVSWALASELLPSPEHSFGVVSQVTEHLGKQLFRGLCPGSHPRSRPPLPRLTRFPAVESGTWGVEASEGRAQRICCE